MKSSHIFIQSLWNVTVACRIDCLACQDKFFVNNPLDVKENDKHSVLVRLGFLCTAHAFFPECLYNHYQDLRRTFSKICTKFDAVPLSDPPWSHIRPVTWLQIKGKNQHLYCMKFWTFDSQDMLVLSSSIESCCYNFCAGDSTSPGNYGYPFKWTALMETNISHSPLDLGWMGLTVILDMVKRKIPVLQPKIKIWPLSFTELNSKLLMYVLIVTNFEKFDKMCLLLWKCIQPWIQKSHNDKPLHCL
jgi:hypothetical protein